MPIQSVAVDAPKSANKWGVAIARKLVFRQLQHIGFGSIILHEGRQRIRFGAEQDNPQHLVAHMVIHDASCYIDILTGGSIGAAEAYMSGDWSSPDLTCLVRVMVANMAVLDGLEGGMARLSQPFLKLGHRLRANSEKGARRNIAAHYDLGNELFECFLDPTMMYSSGVFENEQATMQQASEYKLRLICEKLQLQPGDQVLEIGTGWGGFALYAARHYGCHVTTTTISEQQYVWAEQAVQEAGLTDKITLLKQDYRQLRGRYNKLVSIEMVEAVGWRFLPQFFQVCSQLLSEDGLMLLQSITIAEQRYERAKRNVDFIQKYIFPGGFLPSLQALLTSMGQRSDLRMIAQQDYASDYARTLHRWHQQFHQHSQAIKAQGYNDEFMRMWEFYFCYCAGGFEERAIGVSQLLLAKPRYR